MSINEGGCFCGAIRYAVSADPVRVTICHCKFCQRATGSAYMVEPVFDLENLRIIRGEPATYDHRSAGSGKIVHIHFCRNCGTKIYLSFERYLGMCGIYAGTFDDPNWFAIEPENSRHIFIDEARHETILPAGVKAFGQHVMLNDGTPLEPVLFNHPHVICSR